MRQKVVAHSTFLYLLLFLAGCSWTVSSTPADGDVRLPVDVEHAPAADVWQSLAHAIEARQIVSAQRLAQFVVVLARNGDLTANDVAAFDATFPGATKSDRLLLAEDVAKLRGINRGQE